MAELTEQVRVRFSPVGRERLGYLVRVMGCSEGEVLRRLVDREYGALAPGVEPHRVGSRGE